MDLHRARDPDGRTGAARRRLDLLGAQLAADQPGPEHAGDTGTRQFGLSDLTDAVKVAPPGRPPRTSAAGRHRAPRLTRRQRWSGELHDRLPGRWQSALGRGLSGQHILVVFAAVGCLACLTAWWVVSARPSEVTPISASAPQASASSSPAQSPGAAQSPGSAKSPGAAQSPGTASASGVQPAAANAPGEEVVVDVSGKVREPGIVTLPVGSRVADAVDSAGGARRGAELDTLNLARVLVDGEQILVGVPPVAAAGSPSDPAGGVPDAKVNLNTATQEQLETLPGIGPVTATAIMDWRTEHGRFSSVDELLEIDGIGDATLADVRDLVTV